MIHRHWRALAFLLLLGGGLYAVLATSLGLHLAYQVARTYAPGELQVRHLEGSWLGPLRLEGLRYRQDGQDHAIGRLWLDWRPAALLRGVFELTALEVEGVVLELGPGSGAPDPEPEPGAFQPHFNLPIGVRITHLDIRDVRVTRLGDLLVLLDHIHLRAQAEEDVLRLGTLRVDLPQGHLELAGSLGLAPDIPTDLELRWAAAFAQFEPLAGRAHLDGDWRRLRLDYQLQEPAPAHLRVQVTEPFGRLRWNARLELPEVILSRIAADWPALRVAARLEAEGDLRQGSLRAELETDAGAGDLYPLRLEARGGDTGDGWRLAALRLEQPDSGGVLEAQGQGVYGGFSDLQAQWRALRWPPLPAEPLVVSPAGSLSWSGTPTAWRYRLAAGVETGAAPPLTLALAGEGDGDGVRLDSLVLELLEGRLEGEGSARWAPEPTWDLRLRARGLDPGQWQADWPGRLDAGFDLAGELRDGQLHNRLQLHALAGVLRGYPLQGRGRLSQVGEDLVVEGLELRSGAARFALEGRLEDHWRAAWQLDVPDLAALLPGGEGRLAGEGRLDGPREGPRLRARLEGADLAWQAHAAQGLDLDLDWDIQGRWDLRLAAGGLRSGAETLERLGARVAGTPADHRLELEAERSDAALALGLAGRWDEGEWNGQVRQADWRHEWLGAWRLQAPARLQVSVQGGTLEDLCWQREASTLCLAAAGDRERGWTAEAGVEQLPLGWLEGFLPVQRRLEGQLEARLTARLGPDGRPADGSLDLALTPGRLWLGNDEDQQLTFGGGRLEGRLQGDSARLDLDLALAGADRLRGAWTVTGLEGEAPRLDGRLWGELRELALVEAFTGEVEQVRGLLRLDLETRGALAAPDIGGRLDLEEGSLTVPSAGLRLEAMRLAVVAAGQGPLRLEGGLRAGPDGELRFRGEARDIQDEAARRLWLELEGERFLAVDIPEYQVRVSPELRLELHGRRVDLTGEVRVPQARLRPRDFSGAVAPSRDVVWVGAGLEPELPSPWRIHSTLRLRLGDDVQVNGFGLRGFLGGDLTLREEPERPATGRGELSIREGRYRAYGQDLRIETGRLLYTDSPLDNPGLDIRAARHVSGVVAGIRVGGQLRDPLLSLYSEPAMSESDTLSYLLFGRPLQQASGSEGATMMQAASALGLGGGGLLAAEIGEAFGFDEVEIGGGDGFDEAALMVGKYLSPRLYVQYSVGLLEPVSTFRVRYQMSRRWTLQTETGVESGADLLFTLD